MKKRIWRNTYHVRVNVEFECARHPSSSEWVIVPACRLQFETQSMEKYQAQNCSFSDCCKNVELFDPEIINVTKIELSSCSNLQERQDYKIVSKDGKSWTRSYNKCCNGAIYIYFMTRSTSENTTSQSTKLHGKTSLLPHTTDTTTRTTPPLSSYGPPDIPTTDPGNTTTVLTIGLVCAFFLCVLGFCAFTYRRYRKRKLEQKFQAHYDNTAVEEFQRMATFETDTTIPTESMYFVLEPRNNVQMPADTNSPRTSMKNQSSSVYESIASLPNVETDPRENQNDVYNTLWDNDALSNDTVNTYSHFQDFNEEYNFLSR